MQTTILPNANPKHLTHQSVLPFKKAPFVNEVRAVKLARASITNSILGMTYLSKSCALKAFGSNSPMVVSNVSPFWLTMVTGVSSGANSAIFCLHPPHGKQNSSFGLAITICEIRFCPCVTILPIAVASAHWPNGKAALSTLQPEKVSPLGVSTAAPTLKLE